MKPNPILAILLVITCFSCNKDNNELVICCETVISTELVAAFEVACPTFNKGIECGLNDISTGNITSREWIVEEGELINGTTLNPTLKYGTVGSHDITLIVSNDIESDTTTKSISVYPGDGLIAYYPLNNTALDFSGNGFHGSINGTMPANDLNDIEKNAFEFNTGDDNIVTSTEIDDALFNGATFSAWIKATDSMDIGFIMSNVASSGSLCILGVGFNFYYGIERGVGLIYDNGQITASVRSDEHENFGLNEWHHVLVTWNGKIEFDEYELITYIDGEKTTGRSGSYVTSNTNCPPTESREPFAIGGVESYRNFQGALDEIRIYDRPLNKDEIMMLFDR